MLVLSVGCSKAAMRFYEKLRGKPLTDSGCAIYANVASAFHLYEQNWRGVRHGRRWNIRDWNWPFNTLAEGGDFNPERFGNQPWTVLLQRAVALHRASVADATEAAACEDESRR